MDDTADDLLAKASRARALHEHGDHERALADYAVVLEEMRRRRLSSASLLADVAWTALHASRLELAVGLAEEALRADLLCVPALQVLDRVAIQVGALIAAPERSLQDADMPGLYQLLVRASRTDASSALALARHHEAKGSLAVARALREVARARAA